MTVMRQALLGWAIAAVLNVGLALSGLLDPLGIEGAALVLTITGGFGTLAIIWLVHLAAMRHLRRETT